MVRTSLAVATLLMGVSSLAFAQTPPAAAPSTMTPSTITPSTPAPTAMTPSTMTPGTAKPADTAAAAPSTMTPSTTTPSTTTPGMTKPADTTATAPAKPMPATPVQLGAGAGTQQQLTARLQSAGFTDIKVMPESYLVQAKSKSGVPVTIFLDSSSMTVFTSSDAMDPAASRRTDGVFATIPAAGELSSRVIGLDIKNSSGQTVGTIKDIAFDAKGVSAYIVGVGGFLGIGDHYVAIRPSAVTVTQGVTDKKWHATMETSADQLKAAPEYKYASK